MNAHALQNWLETSGFSLLVGVALASSVLCLSAWLASRLLNRLGAATRFGVWQLALVGVLLATALLMGMDGIPLGPAMIVVTDSRADVRERLSPDQVVTPAAKPNLATNEHRSNMSEEQPNTPAAIAAPASSRSWQISVSAILAGTWILLSVGLLVRVLGSTLRAYGVVHRAELAHSPQVLRAFDAARKRIGLTTARNVPLLRTTELAVPFTLGSLRPSIVLPAEAEQWSSAVLEMVLAHELAHVARLDACGHLLNRIACCLAGFNPLVWLAVRRCAFERELACDNRVLAAGYAAADYGACLVDIAAKMTGRRLPSPALSMAYPKFRSRLEEVLKCRNSRGPLSKSALCLLAAVFVTLAAGAGLLRPFESRTVAAKQPAVVASEPTQTPAKQTTPEAQPADSPAVGRGTVVDAIGQPISGVNISLELIDDNRPGSDPSRVLRSWDLVSDQSGEFEATGGNVGELPPEATIRVRAKVDGYVPSDRVWYLTDKERATGEWSVKPQLWTAKKVVGHVVDTDGKPVAGHIDAAGVFDEPNKNWWQRGVQVAANGQFEILVPELMQVELLVMVEDRAPTRVAIARNVTDVGEVRMQRGTRVSGKLIDREGQPVAAVAIGMRSLDDGSLEGFSLAAEAAVLSDDEGRFSLPPMSGECSVWAASTARTRGPANEEISGRRPPPVIPIVVTLPANGAVTEISVELKEAEVATISGAATFEDGTPVVGLEIKAGGGASMATLAQTLTDSEGRYELKVPIPLSTAYLNAFGAKNSEGTWLMAFGYCQAAQSDNSQFIDFGSLDSDHDDANWVLKPYKRN